MEERLSEIPSSVEKAGLLGAFGNYNLVEA